MLDSPDRLYGYRNGLAYILGRVQGGFDGRQLLFDAESRQVLIVGGHRGLTEHSVDAVLDAEPGVGFEATAEGPWVHTPQLLHSAFGWTWRLGDESTDDSSFAMELTVGHQLRWEGRDEVDRGLVLWPHLGYAYQAGPEERTHLGAVGLSVGYGSEAWRLMYRPRGVLGSRAGVFTTGLRHGLYAEFLFGLVSVEVIHQLLWTDGTQTQDVQILVGLTPVRLALIFWLFGL
jgi:hypothetical protein